MKLAAEPLTRAEVNALLAQCSRRAPTGIRNRALITVLYRTGLRIFEALALQPKDVDLDNGTLRVLHGKGDKMRTVGLDAGTIDSRRGGSKSGPRMCPEMADDRCSARWTGARCSSICAGTCYQDRGQGWSREARPPPRLPSHACGRAGASASPMTVIPSSARACQPGYY